MSRGGSRMHVVFDHKSCCRLSAAVASTSSMQPGQRTPRFGIKRPSSIGVGMRHSAHRTAGPVTGTSGRCFGSAPSLTSALAESAASLAMISLQTSTHGYQQSARSRRACAFTDATSSIARCGSVKFLVHVRTAGLTFQLPGPSPRRDFARRIALHAKRPEREVRMACQP
jgi:hypothetical protein